MPPPPTTETKSRRVPRKTPSKLFLKAGIAASGVVGTVFIGQFWLETYLKSETFRLKTEEAVGRALHAKAQLSEVRRQGTTIGSETLNLEGGTGSVFKKAQIQGLRAELDLGGLWNRLWKVDHLSLLRLELNLDAPAQTPRADHANDDSPPSKSPFPASLLPNKATIHLIQSDRATFTKGGVEVLQTRATASPQDSGWSVVLGGGELRCPGVPRMEIEEAKLHVTPEGGTLRNARLLLKTGGQFKLTGDWSAASRANLYAQIENTDVAPFLPPWWQARLHGFLHGTIHLTQPAKSPASGGPELSGDLRMTGGKLEGLPILAQLDSFLGNPRFRQVALKTATAHIRKTGDKTEFHDIDLDAEGILRIKGSVSVEKSRISGSLKLGISPAFVQWLPTGRNVLFGETAEGYVWAPFQVYGTLEDPREDLSSRLAAGVVEGVTEAAKGLPKELPKALPEAAKGLLDAVKSILPGR